MMGHRHSSWRPGITEANVAEVQHVFQKHHIKWLRVDGAESSNAFYQPERFHLKMGMCPHDKCFLQQLLPVDYLRRLTYAQQICCELGSASGFLDDMLFFDECVFHTNGVVEKHNARVCRQKNPYTVVEVLHTLQRS